MTLKSSRSSVLCRGSVSAIALSAVMTAFGPVHAQQADATLGGIEEITVTATRRATGLQDIGISVSAFSGEALKDMNVTATDDLTIITPGLSFIQAGGAPLAGLIAIRGVAQNDFAQHLESANILYVDDVYRPSNGGNLQNLFDMERVEVLKGPQGTLFGRNATGGLIHMITKDPVMDELGGYARLTIGEYNQITGEGAVNVPMGDKAAMRLAVFANHNDGWIKNGIGPDQMADDTLAMRGKVLLTPNEDLRIKLQAEYTRNYSNPAGAAFPTGGFVGPDTLGQFKAPPAPTDTGYIDADGSPWTGEFDFPGLFEREDIMVFGDISYTWDNLTFTSITSYSELDITYEEDNDLTPFDITIFRQNTEQENFTQEFRVNGDYEDTRVTAGLYYLDIDGDYFQNFQINNLGNFDEVLAPIPVLLLPVGLNQYGDYSLSTKSWSVFAQGEHDINEQFTVTAGLRYTRDKKNYSYQNFCENLLAAPACAPADPATLAGAGLVTDKHSEGGLSARLQLDYRVQEDWLLFAAYNRGYKAFNYNAGFAGAAPVEGVRFKGEKLNAFEIGSKADFWDRKARFNISAYYYDYNNYQAFDQRGTSFILSNTDATIYGADAELTLSPGAGINAMFGLAYIHTNVKDIPIGGQLYDVEAPQAPEISFNFAVSKDFQVGDGAVRVGFDGNYTDSYFSQLNNAPVTEAGDHWLVNTRISYAPDNGNWEVAAFGRNLFKEKRLLYAFDITFPGNGLVEQVYGKPQWFGGEIRVNF